MGQEGRQELRCPVYIRIGLGATPGARRSYGTGLSQQELRSNRVCTSDVRRMSDRTMQIVGRRAWVTG